MALLPRIYDAVLAPFEALGLARLRGELLAGLEGRVLDVGAGTGVNFHHLPPGVRAVAVEPDAEMLRRAVPRAGSVELVQADGQALPFADETFDAVIFTLALCTIPDPIRAIREARRVLRPGGVLVALEHVRAPGPVLSGLQHALTPAWKHVAGGCHLDRDTEAVLRREGLTEIDRRTFARGVVLASRWLRES